MSDEKAPAQTLLTAHTSPALVKKTFTRLGKLLDILSAEMANPLPPKAKYELLDSEGFKTLATKLSNTITKYVLFVCREGTMKTIESQTSILLEDIRKMCTSLRAMHGTATKTLHNVIVRIGTRILKEIKELTADISLQIAHQYNLRDHPDATADVEGNNHISRLTARVWGTCDRLANMPTDNKSAIACVVREQHEVVLDAHRELGELVEGDKEFPDADSDKEEQDDEFDGLDDEERELMALENELNQMGTKLRSADKPKTVSANDGLQDDDDLDFDERELAKSEYKYVNHAKTLVRIVSAVLKKTGEVMAQMKSPYDVSADGEVNLAAVANSTDKGLIDVKKRIQDFELSLEDRRRDAETISAHVDNMSNALYTPQDLTAAARSAYFVASRTAKLVLWLDKYDSEGWCAEYHALAQTQRVENVKELQAASLETYGSSSASSKKEWHHCRIVNPTLPAPARHMISQEDTEEEPESEFTSADTLRRRNEWANVKMSSYSSWPLLNEMRANLFTAIETPESLVNLHMVYRTGDELVDDSEDEEEPFGYEGDEDDADDDAMYGYDEYDNDNIIYY